MMDWKLFDTLTLFEKMCDKKAMYLTDAVKAGKLAEITLSFEVQKDEHGVVKDIAHFVELSWKE